MNIEMTWQNKGFHFNGKSPSNHLINYDSGPSGTETQGFTPMEAVLQSAAVCSGMDIVSILDKKRKSPDHFSIEVSAERAETHPKIFTAIHLVYKFKGNGLTEKDAEQAIKLSVEKYCSVIGMIRNTVDVSWEYKINN